MTEYRKIDRESRRAELVSNVLHFVLIAMFGAFSVMITLRSLNVI